MTMHVVVHVRQTAPKNMRMFGQQGCNDWVTRKLSTANGRLSTQRVSLHLPQRQLFPHRFRRYHQYQHPSGPYKSYTSAKRAIWSIIAINGAVFGAWQYANANRDRQLQSRLLHHATLSWANIRAERWYTLVTSAFSHENLPHFIFNMFAISTFGGIISRVPGIGGVRIWSLCLGSAIAGSLSWLYQRQSQARSSQSGPRQLLGQDVRDRVMHASTAYGASGMVMGVGAVATCLIPRAPIYLMFIPIPIPLWAVTMLYAATDIYYLDSSDKIGHAAHLGGSIYGLLYYTSFLRRFGGIFGPRLYRW